MNNSEIPPSVNSPWSLQADYANPQLYGWASIVFGIISLLAGAYVLVASWVLLPVAMFLGLGAALLAVGIWLMRYAE